MGSLNHQQYVGMHLKPWRFLIQFFEHIFLDGWQEKTRLVSALSLGMQNSIPRMQSCQNEGYITYPNTQCMVYLGSKKHHALSVCVIYSLTPLVLLSLLSCSTTQASSVNKKPSLVFPKNYLMATLRSPAKS